MMREEKVGRFCETGRAGRSLLSPPFVSVSCGTDDGGSTGSPCWEEANDEAVDVEAVGAGEGCASVVLADTSAAAGAGGGEVEVSTAMAVVIGTLLVATIWDSDSGASWRGRQSIKRLDRIGKRRECYQ